MKQTPKPLRIQALANSIDSPLRRRSGINIVPASSVESPNTVSFVSILL